MNEMIIFKTEDDAVSIDVRFDPGEETVWLTQGQMCDLYQTSKSNISEHIKHIFDEGELEEQAVVRKFRTTAADGKEYNTKHYNLDGILTATGEQLLVGSGSVSHAKAIEKAHDEYRKYQQRTLSRAEQDYINTIKQLGKRTKKDGES